MQYFGEHNTKVGFISGLIGGSIRFLTELNGSYSINLLMAAFTALICGACGVIGKIVIEWIYKKYIKKR